MRLAAPGTWLPTCHVPPCRASCGGVDGSAGPEERPLGHALLLLEWRAGAKEREREGPGRWGGPLRSPVQERSAGLARCWIACSAGMVLERMKIPEGGEARERE